MPDIVIIVGKDGKMRHLYHPIADQITDSVSDKSELHRASHLEPTEELSKAALHWLRDNYADTDLRTCTDMHSVRERLPRGWWADLSPMNGGVLGPFASKPEAAAAEETWLLANNLQPIKVQAVRYPLLCKARRFLTNLVKKLTLIERINNANADSSRQP